MNQDTDVHLRWNEHQTNLLSVFSSLLGNENLVDCTISAEGQHLKAHRLILSACSPYFGTLLSQHYDKHPIVILPDVKFEILKGLMEFMYSGELKISQDKLHAVLELADTLQIKGLSSVGESEIKDDLRPKRRNESSILCDQQSFKKHMSEHRSGSQVKLGEDISSLHASEKEHSEDIDRCPRSAQKCISPKRTVEEAAMFQDISDNDAFSTCQYSSVTETLIKSKTDLSGTLLNSNSNTLDSSQLSGPHIVRVGEKRMSSENVISTHLSSDKFRTSACVGESGKRPDADLPPQMKQEDPDDFHSNSVEEIVLDDDTDENDDLAHGSGYDNSSTVAVRMISEDAFSGQGFCNVEPNGDTYHVEPTSLLPNRFKCNVCLKSYRRQNHLRRHVKYECGKERQFPCPHCPWRFFHKHNLKMHILTKHGGDMFKL